MSPRGKRITAGQIGQYTYCSCAWWLNTVEGRRPATLEPLEAGIQMHERHGRQVAVARLARRLATAMILLAALPLGIWGLARLLG